MQRSKIDYEKNIKTCCTCGKWKAFTEFRIPRDTKSGYSGRCKDCYRLYHREYMQKKYSDPKKREQRKVRSQAWRDKNRLWFRKRARDYARKVRMECLLAYGGNPPKCSCCGESNFEFLAIDHTENNGAEDRKNRKATAITHQLRREGYPSGYQVLCHNCNLAKAFYDVCPHKLSSIII